MSDDKTIIERCDDCKKIIAYKGKLHNIAHSDIDWCKCALNSRCIKEEDGTLTFREEPILATLESTVDDIEAEARHLWRLVYARRMSDSMDPISLADFAHNAYLKKFGSGDGKG